MDQRGKRRIIPLPQTVDTESILHSRSFQPSPFSANNQDSLPPIQQSPMIQKQWSNFDKLYNKRIDMRLGDQSLIMRSGA